MLPVFIWFVRLLSLLLLLAWIIKLQFIFSLSCFPIVHTMLWIIQSPQKYFAYDQISVLEYFKLMWIKYEDSARPSQ